MADTVATNDFCRRCARLGSTCCNNPLVPLTMKDIDRLTSLGYDPDRYLAVARYYLDPELHEDWWLGGFATVGGRRYRATVRRVRGACPFLSNGCLLGANRPLVCRIYPFWITPNLELIYLGDLCLIPKHIPDKVEGLRAIGESCDSIREVWSQIKDDFERRRDEHERFARSQLASQPVMAAIDGFDELRSRMNQLVDSKMLSPDLALLLPVDARQLRAAFATYLASGNYLPFRHILERSEYVVTPETAVVERLLDVDAADARDWWIRSAANLPDR